MFSVLRRQSFITRLLKPPDGSQASVVVSSARAVRLQSAVRLASSSLADDLGKLLIANRGEIACRVITTAKRLGLPTVSVFSEADRSAMHVRMADDAVCIGPAPPKDSYLCIPAILEAAKRTGARAIHPGYGFLSESERFVRACTDAGLTFVGPPEHAISAMGNKSNSKDIITAAGIDVVPGYHGPKLTLEEYQEEAERIGFPILIKAVLGGGGKGMKIATCQADLQDALESAVREAKASFGDDAILLERLVSQPRHVEVQVLADNHGNCVHVFERDCSVQRRHQKVLEEAPAPGFDSHRRASLGAAAVRAAKAVGYSGAGTVEFLIDAATDEAFFMEMNTRLQVEHPVSELISGLDLVEMQLRVAAGEELHLTQADLEPHGHAAEARIYSEEPRRDFLPSGGRIRHLSPPPGCVQFVNSETSPRWDSAAQLGEDVGVHYDPLIAKLITWGATRDEAMQRLHVALQGVQIAGLPTNVEFLKRLVKHPSFLKGGFTTAFLEQYKHDVVPDETGTEEANTALLMAVMTRAITAADAHTAGLADGAWAIKDGYRMWGTEPYKIPVRLDVPDHDTVFEATVTWTAADSIQLGLPRQQQVPVRDIVVDGCTVTATIAGKQVKCTVSQGTAPDGALSDVWVHGKQFSFEFPYKMWESEEGRVTGMMGNMLVAPMTSTVAKIKVGNGQVVTEGTTLVVVEAMKMELMLKAPYHCTVDDILVQQGQVVQEAVPLVCLRREDS
eukprot:jgi/Ulvmu1/7912/UM004_0144.1